LTMSPGEAALACSTLLFIRSVVRRMLPRPKWHARRDSNPQPAVLETAALPIELLAYSFEKYRFEKWQRRLAPPRLSHPFRGAGEPAPAARVT
jgi:hypothetical protein